MAGKAIVGGLLDAALGGGKKAMTAEVTEVVAKQQARQQALKIGPRVPNHIFEVDKVSDNFSEFLNKPRPKASNIIEDPVEAKAYKKAGQDYYRENQKLGGYPYYKDKITGEPTHYLKSNSAFNKDGSLRVKAVKLSERDARTARRNQWEREQTLGPSGRDTFVHHKTPLGFIDRVAAGLNAADRRKFYKYVHGSDRWPSLKVGNEAENLVGKVGDEAFHPVHVQVHDLIKMAGLDGDKVDFTGATMKQRFDFLDEVAPILDQIDEYIFNQRMADQYPQHYKPFTQTY